MNGFPSSPNPDILSPELRNPAIREIILGNYRIVYRLRGSLAEVLTVYHGAKLLKASKLK
ncbi:MAG TPA: type II toxin-antitoxin system RelE/ParE family toxin [bacterium]|nr:type II toxin-antitoxin system RelE/ParE family toxin [bacterium]